MKNAQKYGLIAALVVAVGVVFVLKQKDKQAAEAQVVSTPQQVTAAREATTDTQVLPQLIDLGAKKCIPCKMMAPILEELAQTHADQFTTIFYDVWENQERAQQFGIRSIPTQIFLSPDGKELFRHQGYISKEDILKKWKELGFPANGESNE